MRISFNRILLFAVVIATAASVFAAKPSKRWESEALTRKADYLYLEAVRQTTLANDDAAYELVSRSFDINPSDPYVRWEKGLTMLRLSRGDSATVENAVSLMRSYIDNNPSDLYSSLALASIYERLGRNDQVLDIMGALHEQYPSRVEVTYRYADQLSRSGHDNWKRALELYDSLEVSEGLSIPLSTRKMQLFLADNDTAAIVNEINRLLVSSPNSVDFNVFAGNVLGQFADPDSAMKYYDRAIQIDPSSGIAYYSRANFFRERNDSVAYDREVFQALRQPDLEVPAKLEILQGYIADLYTDSLQQPRITDLFKVLTDLHPHEADIHKLYMGYLIAINDYAGAAQQADDALSLDPSDEKGWLRLVALYGQAGENEKAIDASLRGRHYYPENSSFKVFEGLSYSRMEDYDKAIECFREVIDVTPDDDTELLSEMYTSVGDVYHAMGVRDSAYSNYERAIELDPSNPTALNNCAYYLADTDQDLPKALDMIKRAMDIRPNESTSMDTYAWVLFKLKRYEEAKDVIDEVLNDKDAISPEVLDHAGDIYFMNQQPKEALEFWKSALEEDPGNELLQRKVHHKTYFYE